MKWQYIEEKLEKQGSTVFTSQELRRITGLTASSVRQLLIRYVKKNLVLQIKERRGLYCLKKNRPHPWLIANKLLRPSYVSLETALAHYGAIPESIYGVTSVTPLATRVFHALNIAFSFHTLKRVAYGGYRPVEIDNTTVLIAEPEKAIADYLYFVHLGKKEMNDRIRWTIFKRKLLFSYLKSFQRRGFMDWAKNVIPNND